MRKLIFNYVQTHKGEILNDWIEQMRQQADERTFTAMSPQMFTKTSSEFIELLISNFTETEREFQAKLTGFAEKIVKFGWPLNVVTLGLQTFRQIVSDGMRKDGLVDRDNFMEFVTEFDHWMFPLNDAIIASYTNTWERTVSLQKIALQELSAPLIPVFEKISVMPLIGTIDTERAKLIMENLLNGVVTHRSEVVLIDITGVPVVDTMVAHHIIQAADAVRLVGAKCMLVGIRPEIAQTIVTLGINLDQIVTTSTLKKGIEEALEMTERKIIEVEEKR
ncbi:RsbT co-antagonist protein RsbRA [Bacillus thermotolerans]|uniref:RsbR, positive regulator of sigma-B n=1 Tax=Bacillus thermotolerans TaxID=1221996 RepID=A0A0F5HXV0_BACTR|nr:RsbT co-antagonist protein RsbRA [Bacillus thermotolerans]KKB38214.1 RsbR, positive regulator of sigma-B [Bacillus thermotolerans]KKB39958.1 RsbR, positive regulator of sigma-B [Bacillus thermotolerans]